MANGTEKSEVPQRPRNVLGGIIVAVFGLIIVAVVIGLAYSGYSFLFHARQYPPPAEAPNAKAVCVDGSYNFSAQPRGRCSRHGGVDGYFGQGPSRYRSVPGSTWSSLFVMFVVVGGGAGALLLEHNRVTKGFAPTKGRSIGKLWDECQIRVPGSPPPGFARLNVRQFNECAHIIGHEHWPIEPYSPGTIWVTIPGRSPLAPLWSRVRVDVWLEGEMRGLLAYAGLTPEWVSESVRSSIEAHHQSYETGWKSLPSYPPYIGIMIWPEARSRWWVATSIGAELGRLVARTLEECEKEMALPKADRVMTKWEWFSVDH